MKNWRRALGVLGVLAASLSGCISSVEAEPASPAEDEGAVQRTQQAQTPPACRRWTVQQLDPCWGIVSQAVCFDHPAHTSWSEGQKHNYNKWYYSSSAEDACRKFAYAYGKRPDVNKDLLPTRVELYPYDGGTNNAARCYATNNEVSPPVFETTPLTNNIYLESVTPEPCCSRTPHGPYAMLTPSANTQPGRDFTSSLKTAIKTRNQTVLGTTGNIVTSDLGTAGGDVTDSLLWSKPANRAAVPVNDDPDADPTVDPPVETAPYRANVDHMIPRVDTHGCACGENSPANALVISAPLNQKMSNRCTADPNDPTDPVHTRELILSTWTSSPAP